MSKFNFNDLKSLRDNLGNALSDDEINNCLESAVNELAGRLLRDVVRNTPVRSKNGGTLKRGWKTTKAKRVGNSITRDIYNDVYYAVYVEKGHRTRKKKDGSRGGIEGKFMLERSKKNVEDVMPKVIDTKIEKLLKGGFR